MPLTLEEELRIMVADQLQTINGLHKEIELLKKLVAEEQEQKYRAYVKIADLKKDLAQD